MAGLKLNAEIGLDGSGFQRGLAGIKNSLGSFKTQVAGAFGTLAISSLVKGTIEWASNLQDSADALAVNVEWLQKMQNGAKLVGGDLGDVSKMILEINKSRADAIQNPQGKNAQAFGRAGMSSGDIKNLSSQGFVQKFVESFANGVTTQGANDIQEVGGRSARNLLAAFQSQFASSTSIASSDLIAQLDDIGDSFTNLATELKVRLGPAILWIANKLKELGNNGGQLGSGLSAAWEGYKSKAQQTKREDGQHGWAGYFANVADGMEAAWKGFQHDVVGTEADQQNTTDEIEIAKRTERAAAKKRAEAPPNFDLTGPKDKHGRGGAGRGLPSSDGLLSTGNFLGSGSGMINSIAEQHLNVARDQYNELKLANRNLDKIADKLSSRSDDTGGIEVP